MPGIVLTVAQAAELFPLASQQLGRIQYQQDAAKEKGIPKRGQIYFRHSAIARWPQ